MSKLDKNYALNLFTRTWVRDSYGLYDYESIETKNIHCLLSDSVNLSRKKTEIKTNPTKNILDPEEELLLSVKYDKDDKYLISNEILNSIEPTEKNIQDLENKIWYVLPSENNQNVPNKQTIINPNKNYFLCKNDIIKLGRVKYAINEIHIPKRKNNIDIESNMEKNNENIDNNNIEDYDINSINLHSFPIFNFIYICKKDENKNEDSICKICYSNENEENNPLVHLCKCTGGIRFAHYECIKKWMETKLEIKENEKKTVKNYIIKSFNCEICKTPYPFKFKIEGNDKIFDLINIDKPNCDYIILESLNQIKHNSNIKSIHLIQLNDDFIIIGRGHFCDIRINDISVSRNHACLKYDYESGKLLIKDLKSKFGTLILIKKPLEIKEKKICLQIGRTYIEASLMDFKEYERLKSEKKGKLRNIEKVNLEGFKINQYTYNEELPISDNEKLENDKKKKSL